MMWAFVLGLCVDIFSNTPGINAAATVMLAFVRPILLRLFAPRDAQEFVPSLKNLGLSAYTKYLLVAVLAHHTLLFSIAFFSFSDILTLLLTIVSSTVLTVACILAIDGIRN